MPYYNTWGGALRFTIYIVFGEFEHRGGFEGGSDFHFYFAYIMFILATFLLLVVMMNMLIAIMSDTFNKNLEIEGLVLMKVKLKFIIDNWWYDPIGA